MSALTLKEYVPGLLILSVVDTVIVIVAGSKVMNGDSVVELSALFSKL